MHGRPGAAGCPRCPGTLFTAWGSAAGRPPPHGARSTRSPPVRSPLGSTGLTSWSRGGPDPFLPPPRPLLPPACSWGRTGTERAPFASREWGQRDPRAPVRAGPPPLRLQPPVPSSAFEEGGAGGLELGGGCLVLSCPGVPRVLAAPTSPLSAQAGLIRDWGAPGRCGGTASLCLSFAHVRASILLPPRDPPPGRSGPWVQPGEGTGQTDTRSTGHCPVPAGDSGDTWGRPQTLPGRTRPPCSISALPVPAAPALGPPRPRPQGTGGGTAARRGGGERPQQRGQRPWVPGRAAGPYLPEGVRSTP